MSDDLVARTPEQMVPAVPTALPAPSIPIGGLFRGIRLLLIAALALYGVAFTVRSYIRGYFVFLPDYARWMFRAAPLVAKQPTHLFVLMADHFEPDYDSARVEEWARRYTALAARHSDSAGRPPQHTWFYPAEQYSAPIYATLRQLSGAGLGEVELHFHHEYDTYESLRDSLSEAIGEMARFGFLTTIDGHTSFAFVHGNSSLDNGSGDAMCGVSREIALLRELGCFGDFTFPSLFEPAQPGSVNSIFAVRDDDRSKSYDRRLPLSALATGAADLMIFEGPLIFAPAWNARQLFLHLDDGDVHASEHATPSRVDAWIRANIHVPERPDWVFVKVFAHGVSSPAEMDAVLGGDFDEALTYLETSYNDRARYVLHYVTAREAYNLARAAAEGARGEPVQYLDAYIRPYLADVPLEGDVRHGAAVRGLR